MKLFIALLGLAATLYLYFAVVNRDHEIDRLTAEMEEILSETGELGWISYHSDHCWQDGHRISNRLGMLLYDSTKDTIPDTVHVRRETK